MAPSKTNAARKPDASPGAVEEISAEDYTSNMFRDGNNRAAGLTRAKAYDAAAHDETRDDADAYDEVQKAEQLLDSNLDAGDDAAPETLLALKQDTAHSRDGTDASGSLDESGGYLGGTTQEVDDLEATGMPVDKIPHMND